MIRTKGASLVPVVLVPMVAVFASFGFCPPTPTLENPRQTFTRTKNARPSKRTRAGKRNRYVAWSK